MRVQPPRNFAQVFWGISGVGRFFNGRCWIALQPRQVFTYPPNVRHEIWAGREGFEYFWWTLDGPFARALVAAFDLRPVSMDAGPLPGALAGRLLRLVGRASLDAERESGLVAFELLNAAAAGATRQAADADDPCITRSLQLMDDDFTDPKLGVEQIAERVGLGSRTLCRRFREVCNESPIEHLMHRRLEHGLWLIRSTTAPIAEVARQSGFSDSVYFCRIVRQATGLTPEALRRLGPPSPG
jgi:AraC-like DNA-binding protein